MRQSWDAGAGALYITLAAGDVARTREAGGSTNVDLDADGALLGIEVLDPGSPWPLAAILAEYEISGEDAAMLAACYPNRFRLEMTPVLRAQAPPFTGWQCPRCEKIHSPSVLSCSCTDSLRNRIGRGMATGGA